MTAEQRERERDAGRDPDELLAEGVALSRVAMDLAEQEDLVRLSDLCG